MKSVYIVREVKCSPLRSSAARPAEKHGEDAAPLLLRFAVRAYLHTYAVLQLRQKLTDPLQRGNVRIALRQVANHVLES